MYVRLGVLTRKHGLGGAMRLLLDAPSVPQLTLPADGLLGYSEAFGKPCRLLRFDVASGDPICGFEGIDTPEQADALLDQALFLPSEAIAYTDPYSDPALIGYAVVTTEEVPLGTIRGMIRTPGYYVWTIEQQGREWMIPAVDRFVIEIRRDRRSVVVDPIPGMYDDDGPEDEQDNAE